MKAEWAFKMFDFDGDGKLSNKDIEEILEVLTFDKNKQYEDDKDAKRPEVSYFYNIDWVFQEKIFR